jgi:hypothetical protein
MPAAELDRLFADNYGEPSSVIRSAINLSTADSAKTRKAA